MSLWVIPIGLMASAVLCWGLAVLVTVARSDTKMRRICRNPFRPLQVQVVLDKDNLRFLPTTNSLGSGGLAQLSTSPAYEQTGTHDA